MTRTGLLSQLKSGRTSVRRRLAAHAQTKRPPEGGLSSRPATLADHAMRNVVPEAQLYLYIPPPPPPPAPASPPPPPEPPPHAEESVWKPGDGIHLGCRSTGPFIMFIDLETLR